MAENMGDAQPVENDEHVEPYEALLAALAEKSTVLTPLADGGPQLPWVPQEIAICPTELPENFDQLLRLMCGSYQDDYDEEFDERTPWFVGANDEALYAALYGWHLRSLATVTFLDPYLVESLLHHRAHSRDDHADPDEAEELERLGVRGDPMKKGYLFTNCGIEIDSLARLYLRMIRVDEFARRFTGPDELDGIFNPEGVRNLLKHTRDELLTDAENLLWVRRPNPDGSLPLPGRYPAEAYNRIADESELLRRKAGFDEKLCGEHPGETQLRLILTSLQVRAGKKPRNEPVDKLRRRRGYQADDSFWTNDRLQAALDLGLEN